MWLLSQSNDPNSKPRKLTHYHYTSWPDHGVPQNTSSMVGFVRQIQRAHARNEGVPLLVHCSAGVGRTGTFMVLDAMLKRIACEGTVDVYGFLKHIRSQRCMLVQTLVSPSPVCKDAWLSLSHTFYITPYTPHSTVTLHTLKTPLAHFTHHTPLLTPHTPHSTCHTSTPHSTRHTTHTTLHSSHHTQQRTSTVLSTQC